jgi:dienelactone hydrolase
MKQTYWRIFAIVGALALGTLGPPATTQAQQRPTCAADVIILAGDTLSTIASRYDVDYRAIVEATNAQATLDNSYTRIDDPNVIRQGWKICIPGAATAASTVADPPDLVVPAFGTEAGIAISLQEVGQVLARFSTLSIENLRRRSYPGSEITTERNLTPGRNYSRYLASYRSEGLKIYALLTVPTGSKPFDGWPVIIFNHGYTPPALYQTTAGYEPHIDYFARNGYIVFRPDYRGHGNSEGQAVGGYDAPDYTIDVLNAVASIQQFPDAAPERIGMWGHSLGGTITLASMVIDDSVKAGVIWSGVVGSYPDMLSIWEAQYQGLPAEVTQWRDALFAIVGAPDENPAFWRAISANSYLADLSGPVQLHHSRSDESVPAEFSALLASEIRAAGKTVEHYEYEGDNHNISVHFGQAMARSLAFFDLYLKPKG